MRLSAYLYSAYIVACMACASSSGPPTEKVAAIQTPVVACTPPKDAGPDADSQDPPCDFPPATCADDTWLVYFTNGQCNGTTCSFEKKTYRCTKGCNGTMCKPLRDGPTSSPIDAPPDYFQ